MHATASKNLGSLFLLTFSLLHQTTLQRKTTMATMKTAFGWLCLLSLFASPVNGEVNPERRDAYWYPMNWAPMYSHHNHYTPPMYTYKAPMQMYKHPMAPAMAPAMAWKPYGNKNQWKGQPAMHWKQMNHWTMPNMYKGSPDKYNWNMKNGMSKMGTNYKGKGYPYKYKGTNLNSIRLGLVLPVDRP